MPPEYTRAGIAREGFDYQDMVATELLIDYLYNPTKYKYLVFEAPNAGSLDDIMAASTDDSFIYVQVKYNPTLVEELTWDWLLATPNDTSLSFIQKWNNSLRTLIETSVNVGEAYLYTNRMPSNDFVSYLDAKGYVDFKKVNANPSLKEVIKEQFSTLIKAKEFFKIFRFKHTQPSMEALEEKLKHRLAHLRNGNDTGWYELCRAARDWAKLKNKPEPDGRITIEHVRKAALWEILKELPQNFEIPKDYVPPPKRFHTTIDDFIKSAESTLIIWGKPGVGKSTYLSYLTNRLKKRGQPVIRHHYYLSENDRTHRFDHTAVIESLIYQLKNHYEEALGAESNLDPNVKVLEIWLPKVGEYYASKGQSLIIIVDGLDHVWRERESHQELQFLFERLLPTVNGIKLIVGTQKHDRSYYPTRFKDNVPNEDTWLEIPLLNLSGVKKWLSYHKANLDLTDNAQQQQYFLETIAEAFFEISAGHPLHLKYSLQTLLEQLKPITESNILSLPRTQSGDIRGYYQRLWDGLNNEQAKQILHLLCSTEIPLHETHVKDCLKQDSVSSSAVDEGFSHIRHLLHESYLGLVPVHNSLAVFIRTGINNHLDQAQQLLPLLELWLLNKAPEYWRWAHTWRVQAKIGKSEPILEGTTEEWVVESIAKGYPIEELLQIIVTAKNEAFRLERFGQFTYFNILESYVANLEDFQPECLDQIFECTLKLSQDTSLIDIAYSQLSTFSDNRLEIFAKKAANDDRDDIPKACFDQFIEGVNQDNEAPHTEGIDPRVATNIRLALFIKDFDFGKIIKFLTKNRVRSLSQKLIFSLWQNKQIENLKKLANSSLAAIYPEEIGMGVLKAALEEEIDLSYWKINGAILNTPYMRIYRVLKGQETAKPKELDLSLLTRSTLFKKKDHDLYGEREDVVSFFYHFFFFSVAHNLQYQQGIYDKVQQEINNSWVKTFLKKLDIFAAQVASKLILKHAIAYNEILIFFESLDWPDRVRFEDEDKYARHAMRSLIKIANDYIFFNYAFEKPVTITIDDLAIFSRPAFNDLDLWEGWIDTYLTNERRLIDSDTYNWLIVKETEFYQDFICYFNEKALRYSRLARISLFHADNNKANYFLRKSATCLIGYGWRKDTLLAELMDALMLCIKKQLPWSGDLIQKVIPLIDQIDEYTDGKETRHIPAELAEHILAIQPTLFPAYYSYLIKKEEYDRAETIFGHFLKVCDLSNPINMAIAATTVDKEGLQILQSRAEESSEAGQLYDMIYTFLGGIDNTSSPRDKDESISKPNTPEEIDYKAYSPDNLEVLVDDIRKKDGWAKDNILVWFEYWKIKDAPKLLQALDEYIERIGESNIFDNLYDDLFVLSKKVNGKKLAYKWLVRAHRTRYGWGSYFTSAREAEKRWDVIKSDYPEKWLDFIKDTALSKNAKSYYFGITRIIKYLTLFDKVDVIADVMENAVNVTVNRTRDANFTLPEWVKHPSHNHDLLFTRFTWPSCLVKERTAYQISTLLKNPECKQLIEDSLIEHLERVTLESIATNYLTIPAKLSAEGIDIHALIKRFKNAISAPSVLSELLFQEMAEDYVLVTDISTFHSGKPPKDFQPDSYFKKYWNQFLSPWYSHISNSFEKGKGWQFSRQWAYEWQILCKKHKFSKSDSIRYFIGIREEAETVLCDTLQSEIYRSSFLRTLAYFMDTTSYGKGDACWAAISAFPIDLMKWNIKNTPKPSFWPTVQANENLDLLPEEIWGAIETLWQQESNKKHDEHRIVNASGIVLKNENVIYSVSISAGYQKFIGGIAPNAEDVFEKLSSFAIHQPDLNILSYSAIDQFNDEFAVDLEGWSIVPASYKLKSNPIPRWLYYREYYGSYILAPFLLNDVAELSPTDDCINILINSKVIGKWQTWNDQLKERYYRYSPHNSGQCLTGKASILDAFSQANTANFFWVVAIKSLVRERSYSDFEEVTFYKCFGTTAPPT